MIYRTHQNRRLLVVFSRGYAAPAMLYESFNMPTLQQVNEIKSPYSDNLCEGLAKDWVKIGNDFKRVLGNYEPTNR